MTAITSTSTSHSGRASAVTTTPVNTGMDALQPAPEHAVDRLAVADVGEVDRRLADVLQARAAFLEQERHVRHRPLGLPGRIADRDRLPGVEVLRHLAAQVDGVPGDHRLARSLAIRCSG